MLSSSALIASLMSLLLLNYSCMNSHEIDAVNQTVNSHNQIFPTDGTPLYVRYASFQNSDSSWGFTIIVNSRPVLQYKTIPVKRASSGFLSRKDSETVAGLFVKKVAEGDLNPELSKKEIDSLGIVITNNKGP